MLKSAIFNLADKKSDQLHGFRIDLLGNIRKGKDFTEDNLYGYFFEKEGIIEYKDYQFDYGYTRFIYDRKMLIDKEIFFPELDFFEDPPFFTKSLSAAGKIAVMNTSTYIYRKDYKQTVWDEKKSVDLVDGLLMNLSFAKENNFYNLYSLTISRMEEYGGIIQIHRDICNKIQHRLVNHKFLFGKKERKLYKCLLKETMTDLGRESYSISYRLGLFMTVIPRKAIHIIKKERKNNG